MKKLGPIVAVVIIIIVVVGALALTHKDHSSSTTSTNGSSSAPNATDTNKGSSADQNTGATITYSDSGFSPSTLTVKAGTKVTIKNTSSGDMQFDSDPHPVHTDDPELNVGVVGPGESMAFTPTVTGTHGYHNHLDPSKTGTLIVQ